MSKYKQEKNDSDNVLKLRSVTAVMSHLLKSELNFNAEENAVDANQKKRERKNKKQSEIHAHICMP